MKAREPQVDVDVLISGSSIVMVEPITYAARRWVDHNVAIESWQWQGPAFACEPRMAADLVQAMGEAGLDVAVQS